MLIRYPGSKDKHTQFLMEHIPDGIHLCEPFAGTAAITFEALRLGRIESYDICDIDPGITALWRFVRYDIEELCHRITNYSRRGAERMVSDFYQFRDHPSPPGSRDLGFEKLVLHQISYSGLGGKAGSPIGGEKQLGAYKVDCRWSPKTLLKKARSCHDLLVSKPGEIRTARWTESLRRGKDCFFYLDPPYYGAGNSLYVNGFTEEEHQLLAHALFQTPQWALSYDNCNEVRSLYRGWCSITPIEVTSHIRPGRTKEQPERTKKITDVLIKPRTSL
jgi:DNA adenine methylase